LQRIFGQAVCTSFALAWKHPSKPIRSYTHRAEKKVHNNHEMHRPSRIATHVVDLLALVGENEKR
jgi:hypothetical protein